MLKSRIEQIIEKEGEHCPALDYRFHGCRSKEDLAFHFYCELKEHLPNSKLVRDFRFKHIALPALGLASLMGVTLGIQVYTEYCIEHFSLSKSAFHSACMLGLVGLGITPLVEEWYHVYKGNRMEKKYKAPTPEYAQNNPQPSH